MRLRLPYLKPYRIGCMIMDHATTRNAKRKADTTTTKKKHEKKPKKKEEKRKKKRAGGNGSILGTVTY